MSSATWTKRSAFFFGSRIHSTSVFVYSENGGESWVSEVVTDLGIPDRADGFATAALAMEHAHRAAGKKTAAPGQPTRNAASSPSKETEGNLTGAGRP